MLDLQRMTSLLVLAAALADAVYPACQAGVTCVPVTPAGTGLTFDCAYVEAIGEARGNVYHMHGNDGKQAKAMFFDTMLQLATRNYNSVSCDGRGYSPRASPPDPSAYNYDKLAADIIAIVDAAPGFSKNFGGKFHLVTHDQGARIAWHSIAKNITRQRLLSFTSLSIPHSDVFSDALLSDHPDPDQQLAAQYVCPFIMLRSGYLPPTTQSCAWCSHVKSVTVCFFVYLFSRCCCRYVRMLVLPNSTTVQGEVIFHNVCKSYGWETPASCQPSLWYYNGAIDAGRIREDYVSDYTRAYSCIMNVTSCVCVIHVSDVHFIHSLVCWGPCTHLPFMCRGNGSDQVGPQRTIQPCLQVRRRHISSIGCSYHPPCPVYVGYLPVWLRNLNSSVFSIQYFDLKMCLSV